MLFDKPMNVFENLIEELKEENLLEETVIEINQIHDESQESAQDAAFTESVPAEFETAPLQINEELVQATETANDDSSFNENDFYRRRAMEEVSSLQMVERVFSGVEREQSKVSPKPYDDIAVSKALHDFLQVSKNPNSPESAAAEFKLMQETESWYSALSHRDQNLLPVHLRRYCETTKPVLSSQALAALARFYRNSPFSEAVRSKFDLIVTRLFSKEVGGEKRELVFEFDELVQHLSELYADWSSIPLYSTDDDSELSIIALKFEDFVTESVNATTFEELVKKDFYNRLRAFKESTGENFYAPMVTATAINCNIRVGNRYIELLNEEKRKNNGTKLEDKYSFLLDQTISEATSKTLQLVQLLNEKSYSPETKAAPKETKPEELKEQPIETKTPVAEKEQSAYKESPFKVNKFLLALTILTIVATFGLYYWVEFVTPQASSKEVQVLEMEGYYFKEYIKVAKITNETLIGVTTPAWAQISEEKRQEVLKNLLSVGKEKGFKSVHLLSSEGKTAGYVSSENITQANSNQK